MTSDPGAAISAVPEIPGNTSTSTTTAGTTAAPPSPPPVRPDEDQDPDPESYEREHVHDVYESIAPHFSATRYKPWPVIASFLNSLAPGSVGLDVGCGNGKYLGVNPAVHMIGSDRSPRLVRFARDHGSASAADAGGAAAGGGGPGSGDNAITTSAGCACDVAVADGLALPFVRGRADFAICVAVIHHLSTRERRREAVAGLLECVRPGGSPPGRGGPEAGKILVYVWALEQSGSRRGWDEGADQDQLVPWVFRSKETKKQKKKNNKTTGAQQGSDEAAAEAGGDTTYQRYYHLYRKGELEEDVVAVGGQVVDAGYDKDNWWVIASRSS